MCTVYSDQGRKQDKSSGPGASVRILVAYPTKRIFLPPGRPPPAELLPLRRRVHRRRRRRLRLGVRRGPVRLHRSWDVHHTELLLHVEAGEQQVGGVCIPQQAEIRGAYHAGGFIRV